MRAVYLLMLMMLMGCVGGGKLSGGSPNSFHQKLGDMTVALVTELHGKIGEREVSQVRVYCTGVWISKDQILTAGHCAEGIARHEMGVEDETGVSS